MLPTSMISFLNHGKDPKWAEQGRLVLNPRAVVGEKSPMRRTFFMV